MRGHTGTKAMNEQQRSRVAVAFHLVEDISVLPRKAAFFTRQRRIKHSSPCCDNFIGNCQRSQSAASCDPAGLQGNSYFTVAISKQYFPHHHPMPSLQILKLHMSISCVLLKTPQIQCHYNMVNVMAQIDKEERVGVIIDPVGERE